MAFIYDLTDTWNAGGTTFNAIKMNVTDTASAAASKLITVQVGGAEKFGVRKDGQGYFAGNVGIGTSSPATALDVNGQSTFRTSTNLTAGAHFVPNDSGMWMNGFASYGSGITSDSAGTAIRLWAGTTERMRIDSSGRLLVGTTTASGSQMDIVDATGYNNRALTIARSATNAASKSTAISIRHWLNAEEPVMLVGAGIDDNTNNSVRIGGGFSNLNAATTVAFYTAANNATTSGSERARIDASGNLLVGTTTAAGTGGLTVQPLASAGAPSVVFNRTARTDTSTVMQFRNGGSNVGTISYTDTAVAYNTSSDARLKENIAPADDAAALIDAIQVRKFDWKIDGSHQRYGMVAQELLEVAPEAVSGEPEGEDMMGVDYSKLVPMLIKEVQSLRARVAQLEGN